MWEMRDLQTNEHRAVKLFQRATDQTSQTEQRIHAQLGHSPATVNLLQTLQDAKNSYLVYELGPPTLTSALFSWKGESHNSERIYRIT